MNKELGIQVRPFDLAMCLNDAIDLMSPTVSRHQKRVAYIASRIGEEMKLSRSSRDDLVISGLVHDIGALSLREKEELLQFDRSDKGLHRHGHLGSILLRRLKFISNASEIVRCHHASWNDVGGDECPTGSHIIHLADSVDLLIDKNRPVLNQMKYVKENIAYNMALAPFVKDAFKKLASEECFWLDIVSTSIDGVLSRGFATQNSELNLDDILAFSEIIRQLIDFRSPFTAVHSSGVAASATAIARSLKMVDTDCIRMTIAGNLHDIGKLGVPESILEREGSISDAEYLELKSHPYHGYRILEKLRGFDVINEWASLHHEKLDGSGYPFHLNAESIPFGSRIMAVADIMTAVSEDRPYRPGMSASETKQILISMMKKGEIDRDVVVSVIENFDEIDKERRKAQEKARTEYSSLVLDQ